MRNLKFVAASLASVTILALTPAAAYADTCGDCFGDCIDRYGEDNSESGYYRLSQCFNACTDDNGFACMGGAPD